MQRKDTSTPAQSNAADAEQKNISGNAPLPSPEELNLGVAPLPPREAILADIDSLRKKLESEMSKNNLSIVAYTSLRRDLDNIDHKLGNITNKDIQALRTFDEKIEAAKQKKANEQLNQNAPAQPVKESASEQSAAQPHRGVDTNPLLGHLQAWELENKTSNPERAFVLDGKGQAPEISSELRQKLAAEANELWQIYSAQYDNMGLLQEKLQEYFVKLCKEIDTALGGKDGQLYGHSKKLDAYNSLVFAVKTHVVTELMQSVDMNEIKAFSTLIEKYRIPPNTPVSAHSLEHAVPQVSQTDIAQSKDAMQLSSLLQTLKQMRKDYETLGRSAHEKSFDSLITRIESMKGDPSKNLNQAIALIQSEFSGEQSKRSSVFHLGSKKDPLKFIDNINSDKHGHHYPRMLALVLEQAYRDNARLRKSAPTLLGATLSGKVHIGREDIYTRSIPKISPPEENAKFDKLKKELKQCNLSEPQIYRLFVGIDKIDVKMAKKIWPALKDPLNLSDKLIEKLNSDPEAVKKEVVAHIKRSAEIKNQFAKINVGNKAPNKEIDQQCKAATDQLDAIAKSMAEVNKNIKSAPVVARQNNKV